MPYFFIFVFIFVAILVLITYYFYRHIKVRHAEQVINEKSEREAAKRTVARITHELGTPIAEISMSLHALSGNVPREFDHYLRKIENAAERMRAIMQATREIQMLEDSIKGDLLKTDISSPANFEVASVNQLLQAAIMAVKDTRDENVKFLIQYSGNTNIICCPNEIIQVFINLLRNSYDAFPEGEGKISVKSIDKKDFVQVIIQDNGEGISKDIEDKIFNEGFSTRRGIGRGFGLTVAKSLVVKNNGRLEIKNDIINDKISGCIAIIEFPKK
jgi:signal transduction histidine kinase